MKWVFWAVSLGAMSLGTGAFGDQALNFEKLALSPQEVEVRGSGLQGLRDGEVALVAEGTYPVSSFRLTGQFELQFELTGPEGPVVVSLPPPSGVLEGRFPKSYLWGLWESSSKEVQIFYTPGVEELFDGLKESPLSADDWFEGFEGKNHRAREFYMVDLRGSEYRVSAWVPREREIAEGCRQYFILTESGTPPGYCEVSRQQRFFREFFLRVYVPGQDSFAVLNFRMTLKLRCRQEFIEPTGDNRHEYFWLNHCRPLYYCGAC